MSETSTSPPPAYNPYSALPSEPTQNNRSPSLSPPQPFHSNPNSYPIVHSRPQSPPSLTVFTSGCLSIWRPLLLLSRLSLPPPHIIPQSLSPLLVQSNTSHISIYDSILSSLSRHHSSTYFTLISYWILSAANVTCLVFFIIGVQNMADTQCDDSNDQNDDGQCEWDAFGNGIGYFFLLLFNILLFILWATVIFFRIIRTSTREIQCCGELNAVWGNALQCQFSFMGNQLLLVPLATYVTSNPQIIMNHNNQILHPPLMMNNGGMSVMVAQSGYPYEGNAAVIV